MIGMMLGHAYDDMPQILHIPSRGFIKSWQVVSSENLMMVVRRETRGWYEWIEIFVYHIIRACNMYNQITLTQT